MSLNTGSLLLSIRLIRCQQTQLLSIRLTNRGNVKSIKNGYLET